MLILKWLIIAWAILTIIIVLMSVVMHRLQWFPLGLRLFDTQDLQRIFLFLSGPPLASAAHWLLERRLSMKAKVDSALTVQNQRESLQPAVLEAALVILGFLAWLALNWLFER